MRYAVSLAPFSEAADARLVSELAREAEDAGWDGFFLWDHMNWSITPGLADPWVCLAACAMTTRRIKLGTLVTPLFRRRPTQVARATATLQNLCEGRLVLGVGLGSPDPEESEHLGEESCHVKRASMTDESLRLIRELWTGRPVVFEGEHYRVRTQGFSPAPCAPIPVWVAATWPFKKGPLQRAALSDGVVPNFFGPRALNPQEVGIVADAARSLRNGRPFDVVFGWGAQPREVIDSYARAGVTWWLEPLNPWFDPFPEQRRRLSQGPPR